MAEPKKKADDYTKIVKGFLNRLEKDLLEITKRYNPNVDIPATTTLNEDEGKDVILLKLPPPPIVVKFTPKVIEPITVEEEETSPKEPIIREEEKEPKTKIKKTEEELKPDMVTFISRVAEKLAPTTGLDKEAESRALKVQEQIRKDLANVFLGKSKYEEWFNQTKTQHGLHVYTFTKLLYDALEGLNSSEAKSLQTDYNQALSKLGGTL